MHAHRTPGTSGVTARLLMLALAMGALGPLAAQETNQQDAARSRVTVMTVEGTVEVARAGATAWDPAYTNQVLRAGDRIRTRERSRATLLAGDQSAIRMNELSEFHIQPPPEPEPKPRFQLLRGMLYFFHRDKPGELDIHTRTASAAIRGTELHLEARADGATVLTLLDGEVEFSNEHGRLTLHGGEQGVAEPGQPPARTAVLEAIHTIQWLLYYPGVLDTGELELDPAASGALEQSLAAYRTGDVLAALAAHPAERRPQSDDERVFHAAVSLAAGQVRETEAALSGMTGVGERPARLAAALRRLIATVKAQPVAPGAAPSLATEWLVESYHLQSLARLDEALAAARNAVEQSPRFGFGWARVAELEFSHGRVAEAEAALARALELSPRNAQAQALHGFVLGAGHRPGGARAAFDRALALDGALGNAWLGRGLLRLRDGDVAGGRQDLLVAATLEPQRSLLRSYLGKAYQHAGDPVRAAQELELAKQLDPADPTPWLYSALLNQQQHRINAAVRDLERSQQLNDHRGVYRSRLLLDQDRAVRSANLASIYRDANMPQVGLWEAGRAVNSDYANGSAHLFLAGTYDTLRDPRQVSQRFETPWLSELLLANLLSPVGGSLSQSVSQQEYTRLFERDGVHVSSQTEHASRGDWTQAGSLYGSQGNLGFAFDALHRDWNGQRPNDDLEQTTYHAKAKVQLTPQDGVFFQVQRFRHESGDVRQFYDPSFASTTLRFEESQEPNVFAGYHRQWTPASHTLFLAARLHDEVRLTDSAAPILTISRTGGGAVTGAAELGFNQAYRSALNAGSAELQHLLLGGAHTLIVGGRYQGGTTDNTSRISRDPTLFPPALLPAPVVQMNSVDLERLSLYAYEQWQIAPPLRLIAGISYDRLVFPENIDLPPLSGGERTKSQVSPKAGFIWSPTDATTVRGAYARSLGGVYYDTSVRLEPTQVAGFVQAFRSVIPESVTGLVPGSEMETFGLTVEQRFPTRTYVGLEGQVLASEADRSRGVFNFVASPATPGTVRETLEFTELTLALTAHQFVRDNWVMGARYQLSDARLDDRLPEVPAAFYAPAQTHVESTLHHLTAYLRWHHPSGLFAQTDAAWYRQSNRGFPVARPGDDFWHFNAFAGYRFPRRRAEVRVGLLNLTGQDYRLEPLNLHADLPRERTVAVSLKVDF